MSTAPGRARPPAPHPLLLGGKVALDAILQRSRGMAVDERQHVEAREGGSVLQGLSGRVRPGGGAQGRGRGRLVPGT
jgi:hypothetical protein